MFLNAVFSVRQNAIVYKDFFKTPKFLKNTLPICCMEEKNHKETGAVPHWQCPWRLWLA